MDEVLRTLATEFSLPDAATVTVILVRVLVAALLGAVIGWEREQKGRAAGLKTHILVSVVRRCSYWRPPLQASALSTIPA